MKSSWVDIAPDSPFSLANIPFGIISTASQSRHRPAVVIGSTVLDLSCFALGGGFSDLPELAPIGLDIFHQPSLNSFAQLGRPVHNAVRSYLKRVFEEPSPLPAVLRDNEQLRQLALLPLSDVFSHVPLEIGDYTDFYAGRHHARNVGSLFRSPQTPLLPNYDHLPVAYHGRASSVVISGTPITRPRGQWVTGPHPTPDLLPSRRVDFEVELGMFVCRPSQMGIPVPIAAADAHIFGYVLMNDWSSRDIQNWEYVPLGPFTSKNFATTISPWVVLADAMEPHKSPGIPNITPLLSYLQEDGGKRVLDVSLDASITTSKGVTLICRTSSTNLLWSWPQMIAHHTISGCNLNTGDLFGSGTISGPSPGTEGCLLELSRNGTTPLTLSGGESRYFLEDGDTVTIRGWAGGRSDDGIIGFGECSGLLLPAVALNL